MTQKQANCNHEWGVLKGRTWTIANTCQKCSLSLKEHFKLTVGKAVARNKRS